MASPDLRETANTASNDDIVFSDSKGLQHNVLHNSEEVRRTATTDRIIQNAKTATDKEQKMTLLQGIKLYPKAIAWSMLISTCIVMEGYDVCLINNFCESHFRIRHVTKSLHMKKLVLTNTQTPSPSLLASTARRYRQATGRFPLAGRLV